MNVTVTIFSQHERIRTCLLLENKLIPNVTFRKSRQLPFTQKQKKQTITKLIHTNPFTSTRYNAKLKCSLTQQNACACLNLRIKNARLIDVHLVLSGTVCEHAQGFL